MTEHFVTDQFDCPISVGSIITYPVRRGSRVWMSTAIVEAITQEVGEWSGETSSALKVLVFSEPWTKKLKTKPVRATVRAIHRVTVVHLHNIAGLGANSKYDKFVEEMRTAQSKVINKFIVNTIAIG